VAMVFVLDAGIAEADDQAGRLGRGGYRRWHKR
jgi:hypothetical protein